MRKLLNIFCLQIRNFLMAVPWFIITVCHPADHQATVSKEVPMITQTINNCFSWAKDKDFNLFFNTIARDSGFISVTPYKKVKFGFNDVLKDTTFWASPNFKAISHELRDLHIRVSASGDVAWFFCYLDDINEWKGEPANWKDTRWTGVLEKREGRWVIVQQHFSFASQ